MEDVTAYKAINGMALYLIRSSKKDAKRINRRIDRTAKEIKRKLADAGRALSALDCSPTDEKL